jgi:hypothetical protein
VHAFAEWFRTTLVAREHTLPEKERVALWIELIDALRGDRKLVFGAPIPPDQLPLVRRELLPELEARVEAWSARARPARPSDASGVLLWPVRLRAAEEQLKARLAKLPRVACWYEYGRETAYDADDILAMGFDGELIQIVSSHGLAVIDAIRGCVAYDSDDRPMPGYPEWAPGIGPLEGKQIALMGMDGGTPLARRTPDGWTLGVISPERDATVWLSPSGESCEEPGPRSRKLSRRFPELRAAGFTQSGRTLVFAEPSRITCFTRV